MSDVVIHSIELCAGIGMLGEGVRAAFEHIGCEHRTVCYVEREASAAGQLATLMEEGALDAAPIWSDLVTFDGAAWRGRVDCVIAGFPCQDLSVAGRRAGLDGKRSGLFFHVADIADACGAQFLVLENVSGITSATAAVMDETEGELFERAAARVLGELADRGWDAECLLIRASDVGASHQRERWFCIAWRRICADGLGNSNEQRKQQPDNQDSSIARQRARLGSRGSGVLVGDADRTRPQGWRDDAGERGSQWTAGPSGIDDIFAPGPLDSRWPGIVADRPDLAPATEPGIRMLADGMAYLVDESRNHQLRQVGNGVVALQAAVAIVALFRRAGFC